MAQDDGTSKPGEKSADNESRRKLLDTAAKLFAQKGFDGVTTRDIAKAALCNISLISYYFRGKEGLYTAVLEDFVEQNREEYERMVLNYDVSAMTRESFCAHMKIIIARILERKFSNPHVTPLIFREIMGGGGHGREYMETAMEKMADGLLNIFEVAKQKGILKPDLHAPTLFFSMIQTIDAYTLMVRNFRPLAKRCFALPQDNDKYIEQIHKIFIEGALK